MAHDVFHHHNTGIDDIADRQGDAAQSHHIDGVPGEIESQEANQDGQRNHHQHRHRRQEPTQEKRGHQQDKKATQTHLVFEIANGVADIARLVTDQFDLSGFRDLSALLHQWHFPRQALANPVHDFNGVFARFTVQWAVNRTLAVHPDDIVLDCRIVLGIADVPDENRFSVPNRHRNVADVFGRWQRIDGVHLVIGFTQFHGTPGHNQVGFGQRLDHIRRRQLMCPQLVRVDIHHHLPELSSERVRDLNAFEPTHLVAHSVIADLVKFRLTQTLTGDGCKHHGQVGRLTPQRKRPVNVRRQVMHVIGF